jgi:predicted dinucleotide-binding enzyme
MTTVGLIGSGRIGGTVARLAVTAGHQVLLSNSRGPDTLVGLAAELEPLARPAGAADRSYLPIAGDDAAAKAAVTAFLDSIGYGAVDAGPLAEGWRQQPGTPVYAGTYGSFQDPKGSPASADAIRKALAAAER